MLLIVTLDRTRTTVNAPAMVRAVESEVVTASAEHIPRICRVTGLALTKGSVR
jgi:hypothetical protein